MIGRTRPPDEPPVEFLLFVGILTAVLCAANVLMFRQPLISYAGSGASSSLLYGMLLGMLVVSFLLVVLMRRRMLMEMQVYDEKLALSRMYEERFRMTIDNAPIGTAMIDPDGRLIRVNHALCEMLGYPMEELLSRTLEQMEMPGDTAQDESLREKLAAGVIPKYQVAKNYMRKNGSVVEVIESMSLVRDSDGTPLHFIAQLQDTTERNRAKRALDAERERLLVTLRSIREGVISTDTDGRVVLMNSAAEAMVGTTEEEARGQPLRDILDRVESGARARRCAGAVEAALTNHTSAQFTSRLDASGDPAAALFIEGAAAPIRDSTGTVLGVVVVLRDITERLKAEEQIRYLSFHDRLTGLYNRAYFEEELHRVDTGRQLPLSLIMGDVNGLKLVNDAFGHHCGDDLLKEIARVLQSCCRKEDIVARWGGDEFVIVLPRTPKHVAEQVCSRIREACAVAREAPVQLSIALGFDTKEEVGRDVHEVLRAAENRMYRNKLVESKSTRSALITSLRRTLAERTYETEEHSQRLQDLALMVGRALGLSSSQLDELALLAMLHDIGKVAIPDAILMKPGKLSAEEWAVMKRHPETGYRIAQAAGNLAYIADDILSHHEWWDGSGYPRGLKGEDIPLLARIVAIVDAFDAMTHERPYEKAKTRREALEELKRGAGTQFDPHIVEIFTQLAAAREGAADLGVQA